METIWANIELISKILLVLLGTAIVAWLFRIAFERFIKTSTRLLRNDPTSYRFLKHVGTGIIYLLGVGWAIFMVPDLRSIAASLLAGAGILAVAVGFASQHAFSNIVSGIFIIIFRPFRIHDRLTIRDTLSGIVEDITLRHVVIRDFENRRIIIPNSVISDEIIINADFADDRICRWIEISISYDSNIDLARQIMRQEALAHPLRIDGRSIEQLAKGADEVPVRVIALGDNGVLLRLWAWAENSADGFQLYCDLLESIKKRFDDARIEIPYPYRTVVYKQERTTDQPTHGVESLTTLPESTPEAAPDRLPE